MTAQGAPYAARLALLRAELARQGLAGLVVPRTDEHQGEYVPPRAQRLAWISGFTGSAGLAVVLADQAAVFVDGRYTMQARAQVDPALYRCCGLAEEPPEAWIEAKLPKGGRLGLDPWLHSKEQVQRLRAAAERAGGSVVLVGENPVDAVWADQPAAPLAAVRPHPAEFAGQSSLDKRAALAGQLAERRLDLAVLTLPDSIAWLLNVRGSDVEHTPFPLSFALLAADGGVTWFVAAAKLLPETRVALDPGVILRAPEDFGPALDALAGRRVLVDPASAPAWVFERLAAAGARPVEGDDPCQLPKAAKNPVEQAGSRAAHRRDGVAVSRFLAWFQAQQGRADLTELECSDRLEALRREGNLFQDLSFDTIAGSGPNGAVVHYRATPESNRVLRPGEIMVLDSGAQYLDGTTDITRTLAFGAPGREQRDRYTRVLQGHIQLALTRFPAGTSGSQLDAIARRPLWLAGLDYDHGTGHGVGSYLSVHEGPQRISKHPNRVALLPGMILSNEPGYYKNGAYGIRIENLVLVVESPPAPGAAAEERPMLGFDTITRAPIEKCLIEKALLTAEEIAWLDAYHALVEYELGPSLSGEERAWLAEACRPL
jgi:Xaa-Pro aminopeptidase